MSGSLLIVFLFLVYCVEGISIPIFETAINSMDTELYNSVETLKNEREETFRDLLYFPDDNVIYNQSTHVYFTPNFKALVFRTSPGVKVVRSVKEDQTILFVYTGSLYREYTMVETQLPIVSINTKVRSNNKDKKFEQILVTTVDMGDSPNVRQEVLKYKIRGASSRVYPKKSYTLKTLGDHGVSLLGDGKNKRYALNSMYEDEFKLRDTISWDIWGQMSATNNTRGIYNSYDMQYVELIIDEDYYGLYGLQQVLSEDNMFDDNALGSIFKMNSWNIPSYDNPPEGKEWDNIERSFSNLSDEESWDVIRSLVDVLNLEDEDEFQKQFLDIVDVDNLVDYYIFTEFIFAVDNTWKNMIVSYVPGEKILITPWDLDMTFGSVWTGELPYLTETIARFDSTIYKKVTGAGSFPIGRMMNNPDFMYKVRARYKELRTTVFTEENLLGIAENRFSQIHDSGAFERNEERYPEGPRVYSDEHIPNFIRARLKFLDKHFK